jgi:NAD(P)-dependent dehydrogenase (short-subunit alcohol dehydrogenase family)
MHTESLQGKTALITGGSKGIGYGIAEILVNAGMNVVITARSEQDVQAAATKLNDLDGGKALGVSCDVRDYDAQQAVVAQTLEAFNSLDALIANAGVGAFAAIEDLSIDDWHKVIDTNLTGVFYSVKACVDALKASQGYVITISSLAGRNFFAGGAAYNASKFGLTGFTEAIMLDLRKHGIKVSTIMPGSVATYFNDHQPSDADAWKIQIEDIGKLTYDLLTMHPRTLPSRVEVRPSQPPSAR